MSDTTQPPATSRRVHLTEEELLTLQAAVIERRETELRKLSQVLLDVNPLGFQATALNAAKLSTLLSKLS